MAAKKTTSNSVAGKLYNAEVEAGTTELSFNEYKIAYLAAQEAEAATALSGSDGILGAIEVLEVVEGALATIETAIEKVVVAKAVGKAELSRAIFAEELAKQQATGIEMVRKDVLLRLQTEAGCTKAGSNTYYQNLRSKNGLTHQVKVVAETAEVADIAEPAAA